MDLGKCLVFHLSYLPEMKKLYWEEGSRENEDFQGLEEPEKTKEMLRAVGEKSCTEAADFLDQCGKVLEKHFASVGKCRQIDSKNKLKKWSIAFGVYPKNKNQPQTWRLKAGVTIPRNGSNEVIAWLWRRGDSDSEEKMANYPGLKNSVKGRSEELGMEAGTVALGRVKILEPDHVGFSVQIEPLIKQIEEAFAVISINDLSYLYPK